MPRGTLVVFSKMLCYWAFLPPFLVSILFPFYFSQVLSYSDSKLSFGFPYIHLLTRAGYHVDNLLGRAVDMIPDLVLF